MSWLDCLTKNWSDLSEETADPELRPVIIPLPPIEAVDWVASVIARMNRWEVVSANSQEGALHATHLTRFWRFVDDVRLQFRSAAAGGTVMTGQSRSRIGRGDLGQNARNLRELTRAIRQAASHLEATARS